MTTRNRAERLQGVTERRSFTIADLTVETREDAQTLNFSGYASLFNSGYEMYGGPDKGGWTEYVDPKAFERTLSNKPDVVLNMNHGMAGTGLPLARTTSKTLTLRADAKGLLATAGLDLRDPDVQALQVKMDRGDINQMSFAFRTIRQEWDKEETKRTLLEVSLDRGDVSIVTNGANPSTSAEMCSLIEALADMDPEQAAAEMRSADDDMLMHLEAARKLLDGIPVLRSTESESQTETEEQQEATRTLKLSQARRLAELDTK